MCWRQWSKAYHAVHGRAISAVASGSPGGQIQAGEMAPLRPQMQIFTNVMTLARVDPLKYRLFSTAYTSGSDARTVLQMPDRHGHSAAVAVWGKACSARRELWLLM